MVKNNIWAYDIGYNLITKPEVTNEEAINQAFESIITTDSGSRLFSPFGGDIARSIFTVMTTRNSEELLNRIIDALKQYEDRVTILESKCEIILDEDNHAVIVSILYTVKPNLLSSGNSVKKFIKRISA